MLTQAFREVGKCNCYECSVAEQYRSLLQALKAKEEEYEAAIRNRDEIIADLQEDLFYWRESLERWGE